MSRSSEPSATVFELIQAAVRLQQTGGTSEAVTLYETWIRHNPDAPLLFVVLFNYSVVLGEVGDLQSARACLERAIALNPAFTLAQITLGRILEQLGVIDQAILQWSAVVDKLAAVTGTAITHKTTVLNQIARVLGERNQPEAAEAMMRQSLDIDRDQRDVLARFLVLRQRQCEWPVVSPWERVSRNVLMSGMDPLSVAAHTDDPMLQLAVSWNHNRIDVTAPGVEITATREVAHGTGWSGALRIGYLSSDLREHAVGNLMTEIFALHDRDAVELFAYYCGPRVEDALQARFKATADHWVPISDLDDAEASRRIADDGIHILVDLNGYTRHHRASLVALRPAPVIVNWLGFPGSMGSPYHHYIIADDWIIPPEYEIYYSESVLRLPCYQPNDRQRIVSSRRPSRGEASLPEGGIVYCCFSATQKISRFTFERWLMILRRVPGSVLWLLSGDDTTRERLRLIASQQGIEPNRLIFAERMAHADHLARYTLADLFLDTAPYGAHTTASDALWMGLPVLTLSGRSFASRVCGSLVRAAGVAELVCSSPGEYVERAVALGSDAVKLQQYRGRLLAGRACCALFDTPGLVRRLEELYRQMWTACQDGHLPRPDLANLDVYLQVGIEQDHDETEVQAIDDYPAWWLANLARHDRSRPIDVDRRMWTETAAIAARTHRLPHG